MSDARIGNPTRHAFIDAWNGDEPAQVIAQRFGITYGTAIAKAYKLREQGYDVRRRRGYSAPMKWSADAIVDALQAWERRYGAPPSARQWENATRAHPDHSVVKARFGTWTAAVRAAGLVPLSDRGGALRGGKHTHSRRNRPMVTGGNHGAKRHGPGGGYV